MIRPRVFLFLFAVTFALTGCSRSEKQYVVLYTSQDQFYAEPILKEFTAQTGIEVRAVFDTESSKTAGLVHRIRAERAEPQCDIFWSNEELHTRLLVESGFINSKDWRAAGARTRQLVINTNLVSREPRSLHDLTNSTWNGRVALAFPLFGTTKTHFVALREAWGEELWKSWCYGLVRNGAKVVDGNSVVVRLVGAGECAMGLTDSDDIAAGLRQGLPIRSAWINGELVAIPSTIGLVHNAPHPILATELMDFLSQTDTLQKLVSLGALETVQPKPTITGLLEVNWSNALKELDATERFLALIFVRS